MVFGGGGGGSLPKLLFQKAALCFVWGGGLFWFVGGGVGGWLSMVPIKALLPELRNLVIDLAEDLLARSTSDSAEIDAGLRDAFHQIERGGRTAQAYEVWRDDYL